MANNLPKTTLEDVDLTKGGLYTALNELIAYLEGAIGENGTPEGAKLTLGLDSVNNTSDADKEISTAVSEALSLLENGKQNKLVSGTNLKTINGVSLLGTGNIVLAGFPSGGFIGWSGTIATIPNEWFLCDGNNGTPDFSDKFVMGTTTQSQIGIVGGSADAIVVAHTHTAWSSTAPAHHHGVLTANGADGGTYQFGKGIGTGPINRNTLSAGAHSLSIGVDDAGGSGIDKNLPPYYKSAFIMKG